MDINIELFKRRTAKKRIEILDSLTTEELKMVKKSTILRCVKEAGERAFGKSRSKFKALYLVNEVGNNWNSRVTSVENCRNDVVFLNIYIQGDDTDTTDCCKWEQFADFRYNNITAGTLTESFSNDYSHTVPATYNTEERVEIIREILKSFVYRKYNLKQS